MAQGQFTKEEVVRTKEAINELIDGIPKARRGNFIGHINDVYLFLSAAEKAAPAEADAAQGMKECATRASAG